MVGYYEAMPASFSQQLEQWLRSKQPKTLASVSAAFSEKSFAIIVLVLMFLPALPIPTGGITHIFELVVMLLSLELIAGRRIVWLPRRWRSIKLGKFMQDKTIPIMIKRIKWFERFSRPRLSSLLSHSLFLRFVGLIFLILAAAAFVAPPFAGLDTLPALGAVIIALSLILEDIALFLFGWLVGAVGVGIIVGTGGLTLHFISRLLHLL